MASSEQDKRVARVECETTAGTIILEMHREWSPAGYDRAVDLFARHFYDHSHFFRTVPNFLVQFGISYTKDESLQRLATTSIPDDPQLDPPIPFGEGTISYAGSGPNSRTSQLFISLRKNGDSFGRELWETPIGKVVVGLDNVRSFYSSYGDMPPWGSGPVQSEIRSKGEAYMAENFPLLDRFLECHVEETYGDTSVSEHQQDRKMARDKNSSKKEPSHEALRAQRVHHQHDHHHRQPGEDFVTGQLHHQHGVHFNADPNTEEGLTRLSWELVGGVLVLFVGVLLLWLRFALSPSKKDRKTM